VPGAIQFAIGNVLEPRLMGKSMKMHPITILLALIFWGVLWGPVGMFLAVPMTSVIRIFLEKNEITEPIARLMAGQTGRAPAA
jgi:AI-2 transport protein TqsA